MDIDIGIGLMFGHSTGGEGGSAALCGYTTGADRKGYQVSHAATTRIGDLLAHSVPTAKWKQESSLKPSLLTSDEKRELIIAAADDKKANYLSQIDLRGKTMIADFFIVCSGTSNIHIRSVADGIIESLEESGVRAHRSEGFSEATWIVIDYGDVIVHVMSEGERDRYKIENLWTREVKTDATGQPTLIRPENEGGRDAEPSK